MPTETQGGAMRGDELFVRVATRPPFSKLHPRMGVFFKEYLAGEKAIAFHGKTVVNTHFPPWPSRAFDRLAEQFGALGDAGTRRLYSVTLAVTNRCPLHCWHCYNAGRAQTDLSLEALKHIARQLQNLGAVIVTLTGGEPLERRDLEQIVAAFDDRTCLFLNTTGLGLTAQRARLLKEAGLFAAGISLDSADEAEHDSKRGRLGAHRAALDALRLAAEAGLYPYAIAVATRELLAPASFHGFLDFAARAGAREVHLLEPSATGRLAGRSDVTLSASERHQIIAYQKEVANEPALPILSSFTYLEDGDAFGCGAGLTHIYVDGSGEVCPCNLVPLSFGNAATEPLGRILERMGLHFRRPRTACVGRVLAQQIPAGPLPLPLEKSQEMCRRCLAGEHPEPRFFEILSTSKEQVGPAELRAAYDQVHGDYDEFWLAEAGQPVRDLAAKVPLTGRERVFEAGCGTGFGTALLAPRVQEITAADLSAGMIAEARKRLEGCGNVRFVIADALDMLQRGGPADLVFTSWVLGYIAPRAFYAATARALAPGGRLAFVIHKDHSPRQPLDIFNQLVARDPTVLLKQVSFDFPASLAQVREELAAARLQVEDVWEGQVVFRYASPEQVLEHLLRSGAGTAFYEALDPSRRQPLTREFLERLSKEHQQGAPYEVAHEYISCVARKT
ncbi:MAG: radical SAM protein [Planctomycetota bacterium]|nr:radical SAM protein [Planctomycetota bacterium]